MVSTVSSGSVTLDFLALSESGLFRLESRINQTFPLSLVSPYVLLLCPHVAKNMRIPWLSA